MKAYRKGFAHIRDLIGVDPADDEEKQIEDVVDGIHGIFLEKEKEKHYDTDKNSIIPPSVNPIEQPKARPATAKELNEIAIKASKAALK